MQEVPSEEIVAGLATNDIPRLFRVRTFVNIVRRLVEERCQSRRLTGPSMSQLSHVSALSCTLSIFQKRLLSVRTLDPRLFAGYPSLKQPGRVVAQLSMGTIHGTRLEGILVSIPHLPDELLEDQNSGIRAIQEGIAICHANGAKIAGLGAVAAMIGGQGKQLAKESPIPITTGNSLTTYSQNRRIGIGA